MAQIFGFIITLVVLVVGITVIVFARQIVDVTYVEWPPWISWLDPTLYIAKIVNYIIQKRSNKSSHEIHKIDKEYVFVWTLRIWGGGAILLSFFGFYLILFSK